MTKRKVFFAVIIVTLVGISLYMICLITGIARVPFFMRKGENENMTDIDRITKMLKKTRPTDIKICGDDIAFESDIKYEKIEQPYKNELSKTKNKYLVIIINDLKDNVLLSDEEIQFLKDEIKKDGVLLIYLGEKYASTWDNSEMAIVKMDSNLSYVYYSWSGEEKRNIGYWTRDDESEFDKFPYSLGQSILYCIEEYMQSGEI